MKCPVCSNKTVVESTRYGDTRVRRCETCGHRFVTFETPVKSLPKRTPKKAAA